MTYIQLAFLLLIGRICSGRLYINSFHAINFDPSLKADVNCTDGICKLPGKKSIKQTMVDLEKKLLADWEESTLTPAPKDSAKLELTNESESLSEANTSADDSSTTLSQLPIDPDIASETVKTIDTSSLKSNATVEVNVSVTQSDKVNELIKLGWSRGDSIRALQSCNESVEDAAAQLAMDDEELELYKEQIEEVRRDGWVVEAAQWSVRESQGNVSAALELLRTEEQKIIAQFDESVNDMVSTRPTVFKLMHIHVAMPRRIPF